MNVQSIPDRTSQEAKFDNQVRLPAKERTKAKVADRRRFGEIGRDRYWRRFSVRNVPWDDEAVRNPGGAETAYCDSRGIRERHSGIIQVAKKPANTTVQSTETGGVEEENRQKRMEGREKVRKSVSRRCWR